MAFNLEFLTCDAISPFYRLTNSAQPPCYPEHLKPTFLQRTVEHHPWIDLFPMPQMRDNILRAGEDFDDEPLCQVLVEDRRSQGQWSGLIVWGDPWDPRNWEVSPSFARDWFWVICNCWELLQSTNMWRTGRGERKLFPDVLCNPPAAQDKQNGAA